MLKNGSQHAQSLKDGRQVFINGQIAADVGEHAAFRKTLETVGGLFDFAARPENAQLMTFEPSDTSAGRANRIWQLPQSYEELVQRRRALEAWAELHAGFLGRSPDHVASCLSGMVMGLEVFEAYDRARAGALADYFRYARDNDLYLTYVLINPQADRSKGPSEQRDRFLSAGVVDQDAEGITIRGGKMLATGGVFANEVFVTCIQPLREGEEPYAMSFSITPAFDLHGVDQRVDHRVLRRERAEPISFQTRIPYSAQVLTQQLYAQVMIALRELAGGGMIMLPSSIQDFASPELRALIDKTQQSPVSSSEDRVKFFKLAWDAVGSEFASRHTQYEMFYAGATFVTKGHSFRTFDWDRCTQLVDRMLDSYSLEDELSLSEPLAA